MGRGGGPIWDKKKWNFLVNYSFGECPLYFGGGWGPPKAPPGIPIVDMHLFMSPECVHICEVITRLQEH